MNISVGDKEFEPLFSHERILQRVAELGQQLSRDYADKTPVFIGVLNGSFMFLGDLMKFVVIPAEVSFLKASSYQGDQSTGKLSLQLGPNGSIQDRDVILVEDIVDTGLTLRYLLDLVAQENPRSLRVCSLLHKPKACQYTFSELTYVGFEIPNEFVLGYGLDYNGLGRNLKDIYRLAAN